ncbi:MAG TPA: hypothetical protein VK911_06045 [Vicinamibacterales bacterium]|nr:hypothetical protein [Vicinamibacterales bacterium]
MTRETTREAVTPRQLWLAVALGPAAWALHLNVLYAMAAVLCDPRWLALFHVVTVGALLMTAAAAWLSWRLLNRLGEGPDSASGTLGRARFMAISGLALGVFLFLVVIAQWIPTLFYEPCRA